jgi:hypothetical protein
MKLVGARPRRSNPGEHQKSAGHRDILEKHDPLHLITEVRMKNKCGNKR